MDYNFKLDGKNLIWRAQGYQVVNIKIICCARILLYAKKETETEKT